MSNSAPTYAEFLGVYPGLTTFDSGLGQAQLALSCALLDSGVWGEQYSDGVMLDCAHNLTLMGLAAAAANGGVQAAAGPITSASVAGTSTSFATMGPGAKPGSRDWYNKTAYGQMFLRLRDAVVPVGFLS